ncbi:hypothetical protein QCE62_05580 [Caballeronia sp. LZ033]|uniref:hypothetical protein n=1 Tax=Caballeronia sp. LZ033 TaxID=3038566 RepID=UPI002864D4F3|nr:hypothetical protein [Caballeronia sp. LZ033]MDR5813060.1 hypothetical protein [Caballeronia sp. LZ033]
MLLSQFFADAVAPAPALFVVPPEADADRDRDRNRGRGRVYHGLRDDGVVRLMAVEASDEEIAERRHDLASLHRGWLADEQRDVMTGSFVPSI